MGNSIKPTFWDKILGRKAVQQPMQQGLNRVQRVVIQNMFGVQASYLYTNIQGRVEAYTTNAVLYSIVKRISQTAAVAPFKVFKVKDKKKHAKYLQYTSKDATYESVQRAMMLKDQVYEEDENHRLNQLLERPNKWCKGNEFTVNAVGFKLLGGERFIKMNTLEMGANAGQPFDVELRPPQFMNVIPDGSLYGVDGYRFLMGGVDEVYRVEDIIHSKYFNPEFDNIGTHLRGLSPLSAAYKNLTRSEAAADRSIIMLQNGGSPGLLYNEDVDGYTEEQAAKLKKKINEEVLGVENSNKIAIANGKLGFLNFGLKAVEMELIELEKISWQQVCNIYQVPPGLFDPDQMSLNNAKEFKKEMITSAAIPELSSLREDWNEIAQRFPDKDRYIDYDITYYPELQEDQEKVAARLEKMPYLTWNEKRLIVGQDEITDEPLMDIPLVPSGLTPITQLGDNFNGLMDQLDNPNDNNQNENI